MPSTATDNLLHWDFRFPDILSFQCLLVFTIILITVQHGSNEGHFLLQFLLCNVATSSFALSELFCDCTDAEQMACPILYSTDVCYNRQSSFPDNMCRRYIFVECVHHLGKLKRLRSWGSINFILHYFLYHSNNNIASTTFRFCTLVFNIDWIPSEPWTNKVDYWQQADDYFSGTILDTRIISLRIIHITVYTSWFICNYTNGVHIYSEANWVGMNVVLL